MNSKISTLDSKNKDKKWTIENLHTQVENFWNFIFWTWPTCRLLCWVLPSEIEINEFVIDSAVEGLIQIWSENINKIYIFE